MKKKLALVAALSLASAVTFADNLKFGFVNVDRIFADSKPSKSIQEALQAKFGPQQKDLQELNAKLTDEEMAMEKISSKAIDVEKLSKKDQADYRSLEVKFQGDQGNFQKKYLAYQQSVQKTQSDAMNALTTKTNDILKAISDKEGYDLVVTSNQIVYSRAKFDITDKVMDKLNTLDVSDIVKQINDSSATAVPALPTTKK